MNFRKILIVTCALFAIPLSGCSSSNKAMQPQQQSQQDDTTQQTVAIQVAKGEASQAGGLITYPIYFKNSGTNASVLNSQNLTLKIAGRSFKPYSEPNAPSNYHTDFASGSSTLNLFSFYIGTTLNKKQLKKVKITYKNDSGQEILASNLEANVSQSLLSATTVSGQYKDIGTYYNDINNYVKQVKQAEDNNNQPSSLKDLYNDSDYDKFRIWISILDKPRNVVVLKATNQTNTNLTIPLGNIELSDKYGNEVQIAPDYRDFMVYIPSKKDTSLILPFETTLSQKSSYEVKVRASNTNSFISIQNSLFPIKVVHSDYNSFNKAFVVSPLQMPKESVEYGKVSINMTENAITLPIKLKDYFALGIKKNSLKVVGMDNNNEYESELPVQKISESIITDSTEVRLDFKDLQTLQESSHIELQYNNKAFLKIK